MRSRMDPYSTGNNVWRGFTKGFIAIAYKLLVASMPNFSSHKKMKPPRNPWAAPAVQRKREVTDNCNSFWLDELPCTVLNKLANNQTANQEFVKEKNGVRELKNWCKLKLTRKTTSRCIYLMHIGIGDNQTREVCQPMKLWLSSKVTLWTEIFSFHSAEFGKAVSRHMKPLFIPPPMTDVVLFPLTTRKGSDLVLQKGHVWNKYVVKPIAKRKF